MSLKDLIKADISDVFLDTDEFAETCVIVLEGVTYTISAVVGKDETLPFGKALDGVYQCDLILAFSAADVARKPVKGQMLTLNGKDYLVVNCTDEKGLLVVKLEVPDA